MKRGVVFAIVGGVVAFVLGPPVAVGTIGTRGASSRVVRSPLVGRWARVERLRGGRFLPLPSSSRSANSLSSDTTSPDMLCIIGVAVPALGRRS